jgi:hypothetical protein
MPDQNVNINVNINPDNLKQIPQLKTAIDNLRESVTNLNKEVLNFNKQNQEVETWGVKIKSGVKDITDTYDSFVKITDIAKTALSVVI